MAAAAKRRAMRAVLLLALVSCRSSSTNEVGKPDGGPPAASGSAALVASPASATPAPTASAAATGLPAGCTVDATFALPSGYGALENVRVVAERGGAVVSWERSSQPQIGDSSRSAHAAWIEWPDGGAPRTAVANLPFRANAAAMYSYLGPTRGALFAYGIAGAPRFQLFSRGAAAWTPIDPADGTPPDAERELAIYAFPTEPFAVATTAPVAAMAGQEGPCESYYACEAEFSAAMKKGLSDSVRVVSLASPPRTETVWTGRVAKRGSIAPAIALGTGRGAVAYRVDQTLQLTWLDASFHPTGTVKLAEGDVGAPSIAFATDTAIVAWAARATTADPYRLVVWIAPSGATAGTARAVTTGPDSAFAPSIAATDGALHLVWMEGEPKGRGVVRFARQNLSASAPAIDLAAAPTLTERDGNARDPEIAVDGNQVVIAWSEFSKSGSEDRPRVMAIRCAP